MRDKSSIEAGSDAVESCEDGRRRVGSAGASWVFFCRDRKVGRFGVDLDWKPVGAGVPLLWGGIVSKTATTALLVNICQSRCVVSRVYAGRGSPMSTPTSLGAWSSCESLSKEHFPSSIPYEAWRDLVNIVVGSTNTLLYACDLRNDFTNRYKLRSFESPIENISEQHTILRPAM